jgi:hypothetical protein
VSQYISATLAAVSFGVTVWGLVLDAKDTKKGPRERRFLIGKGVVGLLTFVAFAAKSTADLQAAALGRARAEQAQQALEKDNTRMRFLMAAQGTLDGVMVTWNVPEEAVDDAAAYLGTSAFERALGASLEDGIIDVRSPRRGTATLVLRYRSDNRSVVSSWNREESPKEWKALQDTLSRVLSDDFSVGLSSGGTLFRVMAGDPAGVDEIRLANDAVTLIAHSTPVKRSAISEDDAIHVVMADTTHSLTPADVKVVSTDPEVAFTAIIREDPKNWPILKTRLDEPRAEDSRSKFERAVAWARSSTLELTYSAEFADR